MTDKTQDDGLHEERMAWIEPEARVLSVKESAIAPGVGADGETIWTDCTLS